MGDLRIDRTLIERLEATAAAATVATVEAMRRLDPASAATWSALGHGAMVATGGYVNRAVGVTLHDMDDRALDVVEEFYRHLHLTPSIELSSWASTRLVDALHTRTYAVDWFRSVFVRTTEARQQASGVSEADAGRALDLEVVEVDGGTTSAWLDVLARGNDAIDETARARSDRHAVAQRACEGSRSFVARAGGHVVGCGSMQVVGGVAWLGGAATDPAWRERGVQRALLRERIAEARRRGCDLVAATAVPSGGSARNLHRTGFLQVQTQAIVSRRRP